MSVAADSIDSLLLFAVFAYFIGGAVKGALGLGMPVTAVSLMCLVADARTAVLLVLIPIIATNLWQIMRSGQEFLVYQKYWKLALSMTVILLGTSGLAAVVSVESVTLFLGAAVVLFSCMSLWIKLPAIPDSMDSKAQLIAGVSAGVLGGISGLVVVPLTAYFTARNLDKETFIAHTSPFFLLGGFLLVASYTSNGLFTLDVAICSLALVVPAVAGVVIGECIRRFMPDQQFRRFVLFVFLVMGVNLMRKGIGFI